MLRFNLVTHLLFDEDNRPLNCCPFCEYIYEKNGHYRTVKIISGFQNVTQFRFTSHKPFC